MHIKQIIIQGFKSYKEQTVIEPFSPATNVIVGRNGSGKSNFFAAIRFVLGDGDDFTHMNREARQALLHEGSGSAVMSAYVEIIFDNKPPKKRFADGGDEVVIRRTIGLKKDEYSMDKKVQTRTEILRTLETAGFAKENPFYIVPQGRIAKVTNMKESDRLALLKEIAGTNTYEDRRIQSLKIMTDTDNKRAKIDETLGTINQRLSELETEKDELRRFQKADKEKVCLEYAYWHQRSEIIRDELEQIEEVRKEGTGISSSEAKRFQRVEKELAQLEQQLQDCNHELNLLSVERRQLSEDRKQKSKAHAAAEVRYKNLDDTQHTREQDTRLQQEELADIEQRIESTEAALAKITPELEKARVEQARVQTEFNIAQEGYDALLQKEAHGLRFRNKAERDAHLASEIESLTSAMASSKASKLENKEEISRIELEVTELKKTIENFELNIEGYPGTQADMKKGLRDAQEACYNLREEKKRLEREDEKLGTVGDNVRGRLRRSVDELSHITGNQTTNGLKYMWELRRAEDLPGVYGTLAELMEVQEGYELAVEVIAQNSLFNYVVDNKETATKFVHRLQTSRRGRLTFLPLEQLRPKKQIMPRAGDVVPLLEKIRFDPAYQKAFDDIFGGVIVCSSLTVGQQYAKSGLMAVTVEGDRTKGGTLTGGYLDLRKSGLNLIRKVSSLQEEQEKYEAQRTKIERELEVIKQKITSAVGEESKLEQRQRQHEQEYRPLREELQARRASLELKKEKLEAKKLGLAEIDRNLGDWHKQISNYQTELSSDFKNNLTADEQRQRDEYDEERNRLQPELNEVNKKLRELQDRKKRLEIELNQNLRPQKDQLNSQAYEQLSTGGRGNYEDAERELRRAQKAVAAVERTVQAIESKKDSLEAKIADLEKQKAEKEQGQQNLAKEIERQQKRFDKRLLRKVLLTNEQAICQKEIQVLGALPEEALTGKYMNMKSEQISSRRKKVSEELRKLSHVNKKAYDQYRTFTDQQEKLVKRRQELDTSQTSIQELMEHLDQAKDEAIERTFKQVSKEFSTIFEQLVPAGHGRLIIQRKTDRARNRAAEESEEEPATGVENYTGVSIVVSFNSKTQDEQQKIQQLSGGQKSLCALCLIFALQAAESSPFVIFDEVDANLDAQYRTAVAILLKSISETQGTQFICTTFRPEIVHIAVKCYGVTFRNKTSTIDCVPTEEALHFVEGQHTK